MSDCPHEHNLQTVLNEAANDIIAEHNSLMSLLETSEAKAKRIGDLLNGIKPALKAASISIPEFCKLHLPFGKSAAYEYMAIASGRANLADITARKTKSTGDTNSAPAEKSSEEFLPEKLDDLRHQTENFGRGIAMLRGLKFNHDHSNKIELLKAIEGEWDSYNYGYCFALAYDCLSYMKAEALQKADIAGVKTLTSEQDILLKALCMSHDEVTMLNALLGNDEANMEGLRNGGHISHHPLREAYTQLFPLPYSEHKDGTSGYAEEWCSEAMFYTAIEYHENEGNQGTADSLRDLKTRKDPRKSFWVLSTTAAETFKTG